MPDVVFRTAQNRIPDAAKRRRLMVDVIDREIEAALAAIAESLAPKADEPTA